MRKNQRKKVKKKKSCKNCGELCHGGKSGLCWNCRYKVMPGNRRGAKLTPEQLVVWSECKSGENNYWYGKTLSDEHKENISKSKKGKKMSKEFRNLQTEIRIEKRNKTPNKQWANYSKEACKYFELLNELMGWDGHFATHYGEVRVGWWSLDYYEPEQNIVIEWDESAHYDENGKLRENDIIRQEQIKKRLKCEFYRIKEKDFENDGPHFISC